MEIINRQSIDEEYIKRFPTRLRNCLQKESNIEKFCKDLYDDFEDILVYRGIHSIDNITKEDFMGNIDTAEHYKIEHHYGDVPASHSVSVNVDKKMLIKSTSIPSKEKKLIGIARGIMSSKYGPATFEKDKPHHNWYLFENCNEDVAKGFSICRLEG